MPVYQPVPRGNCAQVLVGGHYLSDAASSAVCQVTKVSSRQRGMSVMELTGEDDIGLFEGPYLHVGLIDQSLGVFEHVIFADGHVDVHQLLQDLGGGTERSEIQ